MMTRFFEKWSVLVLIAVVASLPLCVWSSMALLADSKNRVDDWLPASFPEAQKTAWFNKHFGGDEVLVVSWPDCTLDDVRLDRLAEEAERSVDRLGSPVFRRIVTGRSVQRAMIEEVGLSSAATKNRMKGWILGPDGLTTCAILSVDSNSDPDRHLAVAEILRITTDELQIAPSSMKVGGPTADCVFIDKASFDSLYTLSVISVVCGVVLAWVFLKSIVLVATSFFAAILAELYSLALMRACSVNMDAVLTMVPLLVYVLTICASIHYLNSYQLSDPEKSSPELEALRLSWKPTTMATLTTSFGLASLMVSELVPIRNFGLFGALGVLISLPILFVFQTAFLSVFAKRSNVGKAVESSVDSMPRKAMYLHIAEFSIAFPVYVLSGCVLLLVVFSIGASQLVASSKIKDMFTENSKALKDYRWLESHIAGLVPVNVVVSFGAADQHTMFERAEITEKVQTCLRRVPNLSGIASATTFLSEFKDTTGIRGAIRRAVANAKLKDKRSELISQGLLAESPNEQLWLVTARAPVFSSIDYDELLQQMESELRETLPIASDSKLKDVRMTVCGGVPMITSVQKRLLLDLQSSLATSLVTIGLFLAIGLRSVVAACLLLIPNVLPAILIFGVMGWASIAVDLGAMLTISTSIGIAVDNELHFIASFKRGLSYGKSAKEALLYAILHCGRPMVHSAGICISGLLVLMLSPFLPTVRFGSIMALLIGIAVIGDLVIIPAILTSSLGYWFGVRNGK